MSIIGNPLIVGGGESVDIQASKSYTVSASGSTTISPDTGYDAMEEVALTVPAGSATPASSISGTGANVSSSSTTITLSKSVSNTPQVTAGYVSSGTSGSSSVSLSATDSNFTAGNIKKDVTLFGKTGTYDGSGGGGLPAGYTRIPYIEGNENQYFDTGVVADANTKVECEFQYLGGYSAALECVFGSQDYAFSRQISSGALYFYTWGSNGKAFTSIRPDTEWHLVTKTATSTTLTDPTLANETKSTTAGSPTLTMALFADHLGSGYAQFMKGRIASCRIWDNTTLVRDYVPAVNSSNVAGMYDLVNNTFSTSASGTNFIAGNWDDMSAANLQASKSYTVSASGSQNISPDTGYDAMESVALSVPAQTLPTNSASSATSGYTSKATITHSTADQYINIPTGFNNSGAYYKVDGISLSQFVVRPDAELIQTWTDDFLVHTDKGVTIPSYSTTATTLITGGAALSPTPTISSADYRWYLVLRHLTIPQYSVTTKAAGRQEYTAMSAMYEVVNILGSTAKALVSDTYYTSRNVAVLPAGNAFIRCVYWSSGTAIKLYTANTYGCAMTINTAPEISSATADSPTITFYTPNVTIRGNTSYLSSTYYNAITDIRCQYVYQLYRVPKATGSWGMSGWGHYNNMVQIMNCAQSSTHKLT